MKYFLLIIAIGLGTNLVNAQKNESKWVWAL